MNLNWLSLALPEQPEAPPSYSEIVSDQQRRNNLATTAVRDELERLFEGPLFAYIQEFRYQPPPVYSEIDPNPDQSSQNRETNATNCSTRWWALCGHRACSFVVLKMHHGTVEGRRLNARQKGSSKWCFVTMDRQRQPMLMKAGICGLERCCGCRKKS